MTARVKDGDDWVVNGQKIWTTGAHFCEWGLVVRARIPTVVKHAGLTYFVVDMRVSRHRDPPITQINGGAGLQRGLLHRRPHSRREPHLRGGQRLGGRDHDADERARLDRRRRRRRHRHRHGLLGSRVEVELERQARHRRFTRPCARSIADFYVSARRALQYTGYRTLTALSQGKTPGPEASLGKLVGARWPGDGGLRDRAAGHGGALLDGEDAAVDGLWQADRYLGIPGLRLAGGTDEILRNIISERVLGLPPGCPRRQGHSPSRTSRRSTA